MNNRSAQKGGIVTALVYTRVSSEEQERDGLSLPSQLMGCRQYVSYHGWVIGVEFTDTMSGKRDDRPSYAAMLAEARQRRGQGQSVVVVVKWLHRLGRGMLERARAWEELDHLGVQVHSVAEGGAVPKLVADVLAAVAEEESRQIGERVSATLQHTAKLGWTTIGRVPWGYRLRPATADERKTGSLMSVLEIDPDQAPFVVQAFELVASGKSARSVARWAARLPDHARGGRLMVWRTFERALSRTIYIARPVQGEGDVLSRPIGNWPRLVSDEVWARVEARLSNHKRVPVQASGRYLLSGLLYCRECGGRMRGYSARNRKGGYRCFSSDPGQVCNQTADAGRVDRLVLDSIGAVLDGIATDPRVRTGLKRAWQTRQAAEGSDSAMRAEQLEQQIKRARERIRRGTELLVDGTIEREAYDDLVAKARADMESAESELQSFRRDSAAQRPKLPPIEQVLMAAGRWTTVLEGADVVAQREVLAVLVNRIVPVRVQHGVYRVHITWTPLGEALRVPAA